MGALPAMCYTFADTITIPQGMFYVLDRVTGKRYKAAPTRDGAMENWKAGRLQ
jgi:glucose dehydrogenase